MTAAARGPARAELTEGGGWTECPLTEEQAHTVTASGLAEVRPSDPPGRGWLLRDREVVGAVLLGRGAGAVELRIAPKIPVDRLLYLLGYAADRTDWRPGPVGADPRLGLLPVMAQAFAQAAERALRPGALSGYREVDEALPVLRGRLRPAAQLRRRAGLALPVEVSYDEHTTDIPENRLLLGAARQLLRLPQLDTALRGRLRRLVTGLDGVRAPIPGAPVPSWTANRLNERYRSALGLAELVLRGSSYELADGRRVRVDGLLLRMWQVFEAFTGRALGEELRWRAGGVAESGRGRYFLDAAQRHPLDPDLVHHLPGADGALQPAVCVDAKYKQGRQRADLYQMLAYCLRLGLTEGHLVHAAGDRDTVEVPVSGGLIRLHRHRLDLTLPDARLRASVAGLAAEILAARTA